MKQNYTAEEADSLVKIAYQLILLRDPDPVGAPLAAANLLSHRLDLKSLFEDLLRSQEFAASQAKFLHAYVRPEWRQALIDHSQNGEFKLILSFLMKHGARHQIIVDVGARGRERSNSYDLLRHFSWRGLLVEANPSLYDSIRDEFAGTDMVREESAVSDYEGEAELFFGINEDISSLGQVAVAGWGDVKGHTTVRVHRLAAILEKYAMPADFDVLSLDIEGEDIKVFNDLIVHPPFRPRLAVIEVGDAADVSELVARGFAPEVQAAYAILTSCGPNLFLQSRALDAARP